MWPVGGVGYCFTASGLEAAGDETTVAEVVHIEAPCLDVAGYRVGVLGHEVPAGGVAEPGEDPGDGHVAAVDGGRTPGLEEGLRGMVEPGGVEARRPRGAGCGVTSSLLRSSSLRFLLIEKTRPPQIASVSKRRPETL